MGNLTKLVVTCFSEQTDRLAHRGLDVQGLDVLPVLLEQRNEEVDTYVERQLPLHRDNRKRKPGTH